MGCAHCSISYPQSKSVLISSDCQCADSDSIFGLVTIPFDAENFADRVKARVDVPDTEDDELEKFFPQVTLGVLTYPALILDHWGRIMSWFLPDIISSGRVVRCMLFLRNEHGYDLGWMQEEVNICTEFIGDLLGNSYASALAKAKNDQNVNWRWDPSCYSAPENPQFFPGSVDFSPGWFAQGREVIAVVFSPLPTFLIPVLVL